MVQRIQRIVRVGFAYKSATTLVFAFLALSLSAVTARASVLDYTTLDASALAELETRAAHAQPKEQCFLYTEVLQGLTELAGRQLLSGDDANASATVQHLDLIAEKIQSATAADAKRLKNAEQLLEHTDHRLADMARVASGDTRATLQAALQHVERVHSELLAMVFTH